MTPAERIAPALFRFFFPKASTTGHIRPEHYERMATTALDAICPKGERVVLDRTGDTDRLVRQVRVAYTGQDRTYYDDSFDPLDGPAWVDIEDGPDE